MRSTTAREDIEFVAILRPGGGRLLQFGATVTKEYAEEIAIRIHSAARGGECLLYVRADGDDLVTVEADVDPQEADRIVADAFDRRVV